MLRHALGRCARQNAAPEYQLPRRERCRRSGYKHPANAEDPAKRRTRRPTGSARTRRLRRKARPAGEAVARSLSSPATPGQLVEPPLSLPLDEFPHAAVWAAAQLLRRAVEEDLGVPGAQA